MADEREASEGKVVTEDVTIGPCLRAGVPFEEYTRWRAVNQSKLKMLRDQAPRKARWAWESGEDSTSLAKGRLVHTLLLEPETFNATYFVGPDGVRRGTKAWEALLAEAGGRTVIKPSERQAAEDMAASVMRHPVAREWLSAGFFELSFAWHDPLTGLLCKGRSDNVRDGSLPGMVKSRDLKTSQSADPRRFAGLAYRFGYHMQAAHYEEGLRAHGLTLEEYGIVVVETMAPYLTSVFLVPEDVLEVGRRELREALMRYSECKESGSWPGYREEVNILGLPAWHSGKQPDDAEA